MRLNNYLIETPEKDIKKIKTDCSEYISAVFASGGKILYRGVEDNITSFKVFTPRNDRRPKDMNIEIHKILDKIFYKKFGWYPRSEGVFATTAVGQAASYGYGRAYYFLPFNGYKFLWNPDVYDLYTKHFISKAFPKGMRTIRSYMHLETEPEKVKSHFTELIKTYKDDDLVEGLKRHTGEMMFKCSKYYLISDIKIINNIFGKRFIHEIE